MALIETTRGPLEASSLLKHDERLEDDDRIVETVEYCAPDCDGAAHRTQQSTGDGCFCPQHIHRSCHVTVKRMPAMGVEAAKLGQ